MEILLISGQITPFYVFLQNCFALTLHCESKKLGHFYFYVTMANVGRFLADRTIGRAYATMSRLSVVVCNVLYCGKTVRPSQKVSEGMNRKPGSKSSFFLVAAIFLLPVSPLRPP